MGPTQGVLRNSPLGNTYDKCDTFDKCDKCDQFDSVKNKQTTPPPPGFFIIFLKLYFFRKSYPYFPGFSIFIHTRVIHIFQILENYPYGYMDITFQVGIITVNSNFRDKYIYPYGYNSQNFKYMSLSKFLEIPKN